MNQTSRLENTMEKEEQSEPQKEMVRIWNFDKDENFSDVTEIRMKLEK